MLHFRHFDHPKKSSDLFNQWFNDIITWLNTIRNEKDHLIIATDSSYIAHQGQAAYTMWLNNTLIKDFTLQVPAHSSFDSELRAIELAFDELINQSVNKVALLTDNESAARAIWNTSFHNLQLVSTKAMASFRTWIERQDI
ncbi:hypothetical protein AX15_006716 [Amanita polypyramis BW_CC]|nr:hypothetical protein AX15_006716 [Amanita polypyramis BW_CC]